MRQRKDKTIIFRVTERELENIKRRAEENDMNVSEFLRLKLFN